MNTKTVFAVAVLALSVPAFAVAQTAGGPQGGPDLETIAADLGVTTDVVETCLPRPEGRDGAGSGERPDMSAVASCFQNAGSALSAEDINTVLDSHRPQRPPQRG